MSNESKRSFRGEQVAVRLEPELRRTIEELARKERRSLSSCLHNIIADAVAAQAGGVAGQGITA
jgi:predicted transcriptional regulator